MTELLTERLQLRIFRPDDFEAHAAICADPEVMRYIRAGAISRVDSWWQLAREAWGKGYATEGVRAAIAYAWETLKQDHIVCLIQPENARSIRLAERLGARKEGEIEEQGTRLLVYGLRRPSNA